MTTTTPGRAVCQDCPWEGGEDDRRPADKMGERRCPDCGSDFVFVFDRTADDIPALITFAEQHRIAEKIVDEFGDISIRCTCGEICKGLGTEGGARCAHRTHQARVGRLTVTQLKAMAAAEADPRGWLPEGTPSRTAATLAARGLVEPVPGDDAPGRIRVTGAGRGVLAEHRLRVA